MFIRCVGSGRVIKVAIILLIVLVGYLIYSSDVMSDAREMTLDKWKHNIVRSLHKDTLYAEYNVLAYQLDNAKTAHRQPWGIDSNLDGYISEGGSRLGTISYSSMDPGYMSVATGTEDTVPGAPLIVDDDTSDIPDGGEDATEGNVAEDVTSGDNTVSDSTEDGEDEENQYVAPTVATSGISYSIEQLSDFDFLMAKLYTVPARALVYESDLVAKDMLAKDMTMKGDNSKPQILIYHTHSQEGFVDSVPGDDNTTIVAVGAYLAKLLSEEYGYNVIHCKEHFDIAGGHLDRSKAYTYAQGTIVQILEDNPSIEVVLDIHRDGLPEGYDKLITNIDGKDVAKIMLFNGVSRSSAAGDIDYLYNRYKADNLAFSFQLKLQALKCYPEFTRRNYIDAYQYNLHHRPKSVLVEVGAQNNTLQEELNAMEVFAEVLHRVLKPSN